MAIDPTDPTLIALLERVKALEETVKRLQTEVADLKKPPLTAPPRRTVG